MDSNFKKITENALGYYKHANDKWVLVWDSGLQHGYSPSIFDSILK